MTEVAEPNQWFWFGSNRGSAVQEPDRGNTRWDAGLNGRDGATGRIRGFRSLNAVAPQPQHPQIGDFRPLDLPFGAIAKLYNLH